MINTQGLVHKTTFLVPFFDCGSEFYRFDAVRSFFNVIFIFMMMMMI